MEELNSPAAADEVAERIGDSCVLLEERGTTRRASADDWMVTVCPVLSESFFFAGLH